MDETKRHIVEHYPAEKLPEELRGDIPAASTVTVTVAEDAPKLPRRKLTDFIGAGRGLYKSPEHVLQVLREGRDDV
jgi:hypothetical protein